MLYGVFAAFYKGNCVKIKNIKNKDLRISNFFQKRKNIVRNLYKKLNLECSINHECFEESNKFGVTIGYDFIGQSLHELPFRSGTVDQVFNKLTDTGFEFIFVDFQDCKSEKDKV